MALWIDNKTCLSWPPGSKPTKSRVIGFLTCWQNRHAYKPKESMSGVCNLLIAVSL